MKSEISSTAVWALGKLFEKKYKDYFSELLYKFRNTNYQAMYQTMIALTNINPMMFDNDSFDLFEVEKNNRIVDKYFSKSK